MVEINKNTQIEEVEEATEYTELNQVQDDLKGFEARLNSMMHKNDTLQEKINVVNKDQMTLVIPKTFIKDAIDEQISKMSDELLTRVEASEEMLEALELEEHQEALESLTDLKELKDKIYDVEYKLDDKAEQRDIDDELDNRLYDYKEEYEISDMIINALDDDDLLRSCDYKDLRKRITELNSKVEVLTAKNNNIVSRVIHWLKGLFTPNK